MDNDTSVEKFKEMVKLLVADGYRKQEIAIGSNLSISYFSRVMNGKEPLTETAFFKLKKFFDNVVNSQLDPTDRHRFPGFQKQNTHQMPNLNKLFQSQPSNLSEAIGMIKLLNDQVENMRDSLNSALNAFEVEKAKLEMMRLEVVNLKEEVRKEFDNVKKKSQSQSPATGT